MTTTSTIVWNTVKGGSTVALKFQILAGTTQQTDVSAVHGLMVIGVACAGGVDIPADIVLTTTGGTAHRYDGSQFIQNWQTPKSPGNCYQAVMTAADGSKIDRAFFKLK